MVQDQITPASTMSALDRYIMNDQAMGRFNYIPQVSCTVTVFTQRAVVMVSGSFAVEMTLLDY